MYALTPVVPTTTHYNPHLDEYGAMVIILIAMIVLIRWYIVDELPYQRKLKAADKETSIGKPATAFDPNKMEWVFDEDAEQAMAKEVDHAFEEAGRFYNVDEDGGI